jgi:iron complex outermembrane receptor protein
LSKPNFQAALPAIVALATTISFTNLANAQGSPEEITVTARKSEESLQDVPISITAFGAEQILELGAQSNDDIARMTVNFSTMSQIGRRLDRPVVRGMASPAIFGEPNASYFVDGVYVSGSIAAATLGPIERVEILRGPQSTQFGRATFSGAVNYVTRKPTNEFSSEVLVRGGNNDARFVSGWVSGPIVRDKLLGFASFSWDKWGGEWNNNLQEGDASNAVSFENPPQQADYSKLGKTDTKQALGKLIWNITDTSDLTFKVGYLKGEDSHYPQLIVETDELNCFVPGQDIDAWDPARPDENLNFLTSPGQYCGQLDTEGRDIRLNIPDINEGMEANHNGFLFGQPGTVATAEKAGLDREQINLLLEFNQDIGDWSFTARGAYNTDELATAYDLEGTEKRYLNGLFHFYEEVDREDYSLDLSVRSPAENRLRGSLGVYYFNYEEEARQKSFFGLFQGEISDPRKGTTENAAVFGSLEYDLSDFWTFTAEARYAKDTKKMQSPNVCDYDDWNYPDLDPPVPPPYSTYDGEGIWKDPNNPVGHEETTKALTPRFTLRYQGWDNAMVYLLAAKGNKPGAFNNGVYQDGRNGCQTQLLYNGGQQHRLVRQGGEVVGINSQDVEAIAFVEEETAWTWEIGTKASWLENRITTNFAAFYISWDNLTAFETRGLEINGWPGISQSLGLNAGKATVSGLELETTFALTDKLFATFAYGYNDGEYVEYASKNYAETTGEGLNFGGYTVAGNPIVNWDPTVNNRKGAQIPNSSKHNVVTSLAYNDQFTADLGWFARTDYVWESKKYTSGTNFEQIPERQLWNGRVGLEHEAWRAAIFVNNILDEQTASAIIGFPRLGEPNNAGGTVPNGYSLTPTPGRQYGLEVLLRFGD